MKKNLFILNILILLVLSSCDAVGVLSPTQTNTPEPTLTPTVTPIPPTSTPEPTPTDDTVATISFNNDTGDMVCAIFAYPPDYEGEAENLIENTIMMAGTSLDVEIEKGEYTFQVWDCQMNYLHDLYGFIVEDDFQWNLSEVPEEYTYESAQLVILVNERAWDVCEFYIRPGDSDDWGENHFSPAYDYYLSAGSTLFEEIEPGVYDFKLVYCDGTVASTQEDLEVPEGQNMTWTLTP